MALKYAAEYRDPDVSRRYLEEILERTRTSNRFSARSPLRFMEVCGTHTMSIFRSGIRSVLPPEISLLSGPGCPVCVTDQGEIDAFIRLARQPGVIVATFGDLVRVPGGDSSLERERSEGRDVRMVYSTQDALELARKHPDRRVVFLGVGFETTAPTVAAAVLMARDQGLSNFLVFSAHKRVMPALDALAADPELAIDGFLLPGHVSVIIGVSAYRSFFERTRIPCVVAGFEPNDILRAVNSLIEAVEKDAPALVNAYPRAVTDEGNPKALSLLDRVFAPVDAPWRGMGVIPESGMALREEFAAFDARRVLGVEVVPSPEPAGCACGRVITGRVTPPHCPLYRRKCTPATPVGPCMVSSEGTCAAYFRYDEREGDSA